MLGGFFKNLRKKRATQEEAPSHWIKCSGCGNLMYSKEIETNLFVCSKCNTHLRINAAKRIEFLCDEGSFVEFDHDLKPVDPLKFVDKKSYKKRLEENAQATGRFSSAIAGEGRIDGVLAQVVVFDFAFMGGSLSAVEGEKILRAVKRAIDSRSGLVIISASGGARMQESMFSLMQMSKTSAALQLLAEAKLPFISLLTDPTMGGVSASFAFLGDVIIAEPGATIGFAGARVIEQTIKATLPEGFQKAEFLLSHGLIDAIVARSEQKKYIADLLRFFAPSQEDAKAAQPQRA